MDVPEDILDEAWKVWEHSRIMSISADQVGIIAQALLAERLAQKERDAKVIEDNMLCGSGDREVMLPRTNPGNKVGLAYAAAIRQS